jgi:oxygen-dependent protoporphyrinogen oxidase
VDETIHEFARRRIGAEAADMLVDAAVSGISAGDSRALSVEAQFPLMVDMERTHGSLVRAMFARRRRGIGPSRLLSLDRGLDTLTSALAARLSADLRTGAAVRGLERAGRAWHVGLDDGHHVTADRVLLTLPAWRAADLVEAFEPQLAAQFRGVPSSGVNVVALAYRLEDVPRSLDGYGYLVTRGEGMATLGCVWESSLFGGRAPEGLALLRVFLGGARQPLAAQLDADAATEIARRELRAVLGITAAPQRRWVFRWPRAIAQYTVGHLPRVAAIREQIARLAGLEVCGTSYDGVSFNHAIASGRQAGLRLAERLAGAGAAGAAAEALSA